MKKKLLISLLLALVLTVGGIVGAFAANDFHLEPEPGGNKVYLSDLKYTSYKMEGSYKPWIDTDSSTGKVTIGDLHAFKKGIRTHPGSDYDAYVTYNIGSLGAFRFCAYVGKDKASTSGYTQVQVYGDDKLLYTSELLTWGEYEYISVDVTGVKTLKLVQNDGGDGYSWDGCSWGDAAVYCLKEDGAISLSSPVSATLVSDTLAVSGLAKADSVNVYVGQTQVGQIDVVDQMFSGSFAMPSGLEEDAQVVVTLKSVIGGAEKDAVSRTYTYRPASVNMTDLPYGGDYDAKSFCFNSSLYGNLKIGTFVVEKGFEMLATLGDKKNELTFDITGSPYTTFSGFASVATAAYQGGKGVTFEVLADGKVIYTSPVTTGAVYLVADIPAGAKTLTLRGVSADSHKQTVVFGDGILSQGDSIAAGGHDFATGTAGTAVQLNKHFMQFRVKGGAVNGLVLRTDNELKGDLTINVYEYARSFRRSIQSLAVMSAQAYVKLDDGSYYIPFPASLPQGEYLLDFVCDDDVKIKTYDSEDAGLYTTEKLEKKALDLKVLIEDGAAILRADTNSDVKSVGNKTTSDEKTRAESMYRGWMKDLSTFPSSMKIGSTTYNGFGKDFALKSQEVTTDKDNKEIETTVTTLTHTSGLVFTITSDYYKNYAAFEWVISFTYEGSGKSPVVTDIKSLNLTVKGSNPIINTSKGDAGQFQPDIRELNGKEGFQPTVGRSCQGAFPYYNFEYGDQGMLLAIGWSGIWRADFNNSQNKNQTNIQIGQATFKSYLKKGETARTPMIAMVLYDGNDLDRAQNLWRRWFIDCSMHRVVDEDTGELGLFDPISFGSTSIQFAEMTLATDENQIEAIRQYVENGIGINFWWMDAGWYFDTDGNSLPAGRWDMTGGWHIDTNRFPSKMADISQYGKSVGIKTLLWFEPERVLGTPKKDGTAVHPNWMLGENIVDMGNEDAVAWILNRILTTLGDGEISLYREDFNIDPNPYWQKKYQGQANREGLAENQYIQGHLYLWDEILKAYPNAMIDSCASGGYRNDFEALRRSVQLHKTDYNYGDTATQQLYALEMYSWMPFFGTKADNTGDTHHAERYKIRTALVAGTVFGYDSNQPIDWDIVRDVVDEKNVISQYNYVDYYKLATYDREQSAPMGWMFLDHAQENGYALFFRRENGEATVRYRLKGLKEDTTYHVWFEDRGAHATYTGYELMYDGIEVTIPAVKSSDIMYISTSYTETALKANITYTSVDGQWKEAIREEDGYYRFDLRLNMSLRSTVLSAPDGIETNVQADYLDAITLGGKKLSENAKQVKMDYDAVNNILRVYIKKSNDFGFAANKDAEMTISSEFATWEGRKLTETKFEYAKKTKTWSRLGTAVESVELVAPATTIVKGDRILLTALVDPFDATDNSVKFTTSDPTIATISKKGYLRALGTGTVTITATSNDESGKSATIQILIVATEADLDQTLPPETSKPVESDTETSAPVNEEPTSINAGMIALIVIGAVSIVAAIAFFILSKNAKVKITVALVLAVVGTIALVIGLILPALGGDDSGDDETTAPALTGDVTGDGSDDVTTQPVQTDPPVKTGSLYLADTDYDTYQYNGSDYPFVGKIPHTGEDLVIKGVHYEKGIFINPVDPSTPGYIEYDISQFTFDRFALKFGKIDVTHGSGDATYIKIYADDELIGESDQMRQGTAACLVECEIPAGTEVLRIECYTTNSHANCSSILGNPVLYYEGTEIEWPK